MVGKVDSMTGCGSVDLFVGEVAVQFFQEQFRATVLVVTSGVDDALRHNYTELLQQFAHFKPVRHECVHRQPVEEGVYLDLRLSATDTKPNLSILSL